MISLKQVARVLGRFRTHCYHHYQNCYWIGDPIDAVYCQQDGMDFWIHRVPASWHGDTIRLGVASEGEESFTA